MKYNQFVSNQGWIKFSYPINLIYVEEEEGTYLFYTEQTGSFRITPLEIESNSFNSEEYLVDLCEENGGSVLRNDVGHKYLYYISSSENNGDALTIFNWIFADYNKIIYCSYTIDTVSIASPEIVEELKEINRIIATLKIEK
ncbi:DUF3805 domain-containing protein [Sphingobacterium multivorum]|uniref:DUF3805 domain-containing protein n=1 Tax=Sphingobacterium multivorum TaxID=28454 RepID=UPI0031BB1608